MDKTEISKYRKQIDDYLDNRQITLAFRSLKEMTDATQRWELNEELNRLTTAYGYMLQYLTQGVLDPERDNILSQILVDAYNLTDKTVIALAAPQSTHLFYQREQQYRGRGLQSMVEDYLTEQNKLQLLNSVEESSRNTDASTRLLRQCETIESDIFNKVWSSFPLNTDDTHAIKTLLANNQLPNHLKSLVLSALMLGLSKFFDETKLTLLLNAYRTLDDTELQLRALINAIIIIYLYRSRISAYKCVTSALKELEQEPNFDGDMQLIFTRLIYSRNTDNITRKLKDDIMPELQKMSPDLINKI